MRKIIEHAHKKIASVAGEMALCMVRQSVRGNQLDAWILLLRDAVELLSSLRKKEPH